MIIYLCGGARGKWQDEVMRRLPQCAFYDPRKHGLTNEDEYTKWDLSRIEKSDLVLAVMTADNPSGRGLCVEVGYAEGIGIPVLFVQEPGVDRPQDYGMVRAIARDVVDNIDDAIDTIEYRIQELEGRIKNIL